MGLSFAPLGLALCTASALGKADRLAATDVARNLEFVVGSDFFWRELDSNHDVSFPHGNVLGRLLFDAGCWMHLQRSGGR